MDREMSLAPARAWGIVFGLSCIAMAGCAAPQESLATVAPCVGTSVVPISTASMRVGARAAARGAGKQHNDGVRAIARHMLKYMPAAGTDAASDQTVWFTVLSKAVEDDARDRGVSSAATQLTMRSMFVDKIDQSSPSATTPQIRRFADSLRGMPGVASRIAQRHLMATRAAALRNARRSGRAFVMAAGDTVAFDAAGEDIGTVTANPDTTVSIATIQSSIDSTVSANQGQFASDTAASNGLAAVGEVADSSTGLWADIFFQAWIDSEGTLSQTKTSVGSRCMTSTGVVITRGAGEEILALPGWLVGLGRGVAKSDAKGAVEGLVFGGQVIEGAVGASIFGVVENGFGEVANTAAGKRALASAGNFVIGVVQGLANSGY